MHGGPFHLIFNMLILWMFGSEMERTWGSETFIRFYLFTGVGAGALSLVTAPSSISVTIGASGALFGILLAYAMTYPNRMVYVYFLFPVKVKYLVIFLGAFNFFAISTGARMAQAAPSDTGEHSSMVSGSATSVAFKTCSTVTSRGNCARSLSEPL